MKQIIFSLIMVAGLAGFAWTLQHYVRVMLRGRPDPRPRFDRMPERLLAVLVYFFGQKKVAERQIKPARPSYHHLLIFWGFLVIQLGAAELIVNGIVPAFQLEDFTGGALYAAIKWTVDLFNLIVLVMVGWAFFRRIVIKPALIPMNYDAGIILGAIAALMLTHYGYHALHAVSMGETSVHAAPVSTVIAGAIGAMDAQVALWISETSYWIHVVVLMAFLNYLPYSKHIHLLGALPNILTMNLSERKLDLPKLDLEDETQWGVATYDQFSWKSLLDTYACTECARCSNYCPAFATEKPLSPMHLIHDIRYEMLDRGGVELDLQHARGKLLHLPAVQTSGKGDPYAGQRDRLGKQVAELEQKLEAMPPMVGGRIKEETLWSCTMCGACQEACPVFIEHPMKILQMRQNLVMAQEKVPAELAGMYRKLERNSNPWGIGADQRMDWAEGLDVKTIDDHPNPDYLLWVGCAGAFDPRIKKQTQAMVKVLNAAGVDFAVLGHKESCTGDPAKRSGNELLFQMQAETNMEVFREHKITKVVTSCPHCLHTLRHDYPQFGGKFKVIPHSKLIQHLLEEGRLDLEGEAKAKVVYHDSCYLGRWNGEFEAPRKIIRSLPIVSENPEVVRSGKKGFCCGAGGARMFMEEHPGSRVNVMRTTELVASGADTIAVACPFCNVMVTDGLKHLEKDEDVKVLDLAELVASSLKSTPEPPGAPNEEKPLSTAGTEN